MGQNRAKDSGDRRASSSSSTSGASEHGSSRGSRSSDGDTDCSDEVGGGESGSDSGGRADGEYRSDGHSVSFHDELTNGNGTLVLAGDVNGKGSPAPGTPPRR